MQQQYSEIHFASCQAKGQGCALSGQAALRSHMEVKEQGMFSQQFIFFVTYKWAHKLECYIALVWKG